MGLAKLNSKIHCEGLKDIIDKYIRFETIRPNNLIIAECLLQYDRALRHASSVSNIETFRFIFALTLPLVDSNSWDAPVAVSNDPRYALLVTHSSFLLRGTTPKRGIDGWTSSADDVKGAAIPNVLQPGTFDWFEKTQGPLMKVLAVPGWPSTKQLAVRVQFLRCGESGIYSGFDVHSTEDVVSRNWKDQRQMVKRPRTGVGEVIDVALNAFAHQFQEMNGFRHSTKCIDAGEVYFEHS
ncbi:uncharacterized protein TNCV_3317581 [Trichonephila clavipes]|nr:uncharacterized protein TNCV_3317581 [Trichonephila clavipes]